MRRRSTFWSRARVSSRSSGPSKPSRLTISSPSPGAITSGPAARTVGRSRRWRAGCGAGSLMQVRFSPAGAPAATGFGPALSPFRQERRRAVGRHRRGPSCRAGSRWRARKRAPGLETPARGRGHRAAFGRDLASFRPSGRCSAGRCRSRPPAPAPPARPASRPAPASRDRPTAAGRRSRYGRE